SSKPSRPPSSPKSAQAAFYIIQLPYKRTMKRPYIWNALGAVLFVSCGTALADTKTITVAGDGSGDFKTVQEAIAAVPDKSNDRTIIHIKPGTYQGPFIVPKSKSNVTFEGEDAEKTALTYALNVNDPIPAG